MSDDVIQGEVVDAEEPHAGSGVQYSVGWDARGYWAALSMGVTVWPLGGDERRARLVVTRLNACYRPNVRIQDGCLWVCWNEHQKGAECEWELVMEDVFNRPVEPAALVRQEPEFTSTLSVKMTPEGRRTLSSLVPRSVPVPSRNKLEEKMQREGIELLWSKYAEDGRLRLFKPGTYLSEETAGYAEREATVRILVKQQGKRPFLAVLPVTREELDEDGSLERLAWAAVRMALEG